MPVMAASPLSAGYDLGLGALIALFILFYAPMIYIFMGMFRQPKDQSEPVPQDSTKK